MPALRSRLGWDGFPRSGPTMSPSVLLSDTPRVADSHPIRVVVGDDLRRSRLTVAFRLILAIPHIIWFFIWSLGAFLLGDRRVGDRSRARAPARRPARLLRVLRPLLDPPLRVPPARGRPLPGLHRPRRLLPRRRRDRAARAAAAADDRLPPPPRDPRVPRRLDAPLDAVRRWRRRVGPGRASGAGACTASWAAEASRPSSRSSPGSRASCAGGCRAASAIFRPTRFATTRR